MKHYPVAVRRAVTKNTARYYASAGPEPYRCKGLAMIRRKAADFVAEMINGWEQPSPEIEEAIFCNAYQAVLYARDVLGGRFERAEPVIAQNPVNACQYAEGVLGGPFLLAEPTIATDASASLRYAIFLRSRFPAGEQKILECEELAADYFRLVVRDRDHCLERILTGYPLACVAYAETVVRGRWVDGEEGIQRNAEALAKYARRVIRGKLPEKLHNRMLSYGIVDAKDRFVQFYLDFVAEPTNARLQMVAMT